MCYGRTHLFLLEIAGTPQRFFTGVGDRPRVAADEEKFSCKKTFEKFSLKMCTKRSTFTCVANDLSNNHTVHLKYRLILDALKHREEKQKQKPEAAPIGIPAVSKTLESI